LFHVSQRQVVEDKEDFVLQYFWGHHNLFFLLARQQCVDVGGCGDRRLKNTFRINERLKDNSFQRTQTST
jgi:hypothetical protein